MIAKIRQSPIAGTIPWGAALVGLAVPMVGGHFAGWPYVVGWLVVLVGLWAIRPLKTADRQFKLQAAVGALVVLVLLVPLGGFYLLPAAITWLAVVYLGSSRDIREP